MWVAITIIIAIAVCACVDEICDTLKEKYKKEREK